VKVVATNMIANGSLNEGISLLCLIGQALDGCRYLQSYGYWRDAAYLAKTCLNDVGCAIVFKKWSSYLLSSNENNNKVIHSFCFISFFKIFQQ